MKKAIFDTGLYIDWINRGWREDLMLGGGFVRYLSAVVVMELRAGARDRRDRAAIDRLVAGYGAGGRLIVPSAGVYDRAGSVLRRLKLAGRDIRSASFVNDVLIALTARLIGATVLTINVRDFDAIAAVEPVAFEGV